MFSYALLKAARLGYIDANTAAAGARYRGVIKELIEVDKEGLVNIHRVCQVAGLGGDPEKERYRDGTFEYYVTEKIRSNDPKAVGPFIFASLEMERASGPWRRGGCVEKGEEWLSYTKPGPERRSSTEGRGGDEGEMRTEAGGGGGERRGEGRGGGGGS